MSSDEEIQSWFEPNEATCATSSQKLKAICEQLQEQGITRVAMPYDGYGDSGTVEEPQAFRDDQPVEFPSVLVEPLVSLVENWLPGGWEINEGAFGELILDIVAQTLTRAHNWRIESTEYEEEEFSL